MGKDTDVATFCEALRPFWKDLLAGVEGRPLDHERVIMFEEREQSAPNAYEIGWNEDEFDRDVDLADRTLVITKHERLPFSWRQF